MILTTGDFAHEEVKGIVCGEVVLGNSVAKDLKASVKSFTGGRAEEYEEGLKEARLAALKDMEAEAEALGAEAVIAVSIDYEIIAEGSMMVVTATGTAVA